MRRSIKFFKVVIFFSIIFGVMSVFAQGTSTVTTPVTPGQPGTSSQTDQKCCIAGEYKGQHKDIPSKTCPKPEEGDFKMVINQDKGCGSKIWGKIINPDGSTQDFTGTVTLGKDGCCNISGGWRKPAPPGKPVERTDFKGFLCKKGGKWAGEGTYRTTRGSIICNGKWKMAEM
jgi:hypothetical protein